MDVFKENKEQGGSSGNEVLEKSKGNNKIPGKRLSKKPTSER